MEPSVDTFVSTWNLGPEAIEFLYSLPDDVRGRVLRGFNPGGSKDGNVWGRLQAFARSMLGGRGFGPSAPSVGQPPLPVPQPWAPQPLQPLQPLQQPWARQPVLAAPSPQLDAALQAYASRIGLDDHGLQLLGALPAEVCRVVMESFDPSGTKDGNVFGRLLGFARSVWLRNLGVDRAQGAEASAFLRGYSEDVQAAVMAQFSTAGTKDGNILARLQGFTQSVAGRLGAGHAVGRAFQSQHLVPPAPQAPAMSLGAALFGQDPVGDFAARLGLDGATAEFLATLPPDVFVAAVRSFDPSGTKDGNVWGRLFGFLRSVWCQKLGMDPAAVGLLKSLPEDTQRMVMTRFDASLSKDGNVTARLQSFAASVACHASGAGAGTPAPQGPGVQVQVGGNTRAVQGFAARWSLSAESAAFLEALPVEISGRVLSSFRADGTKDGNVWGRLFGFVRSVWSQRLGVDPQSFAHIKSLPPEVQQTVGGTRIQPGDTEWRTPDASCFQGLPQKSPLPRI